MSRYWDVDTVVGDVSCRRKKRKKTSADGRGWKVFNRREAALPPQITALTALGRGSGRSQLQNQIAWQERAIFKLLETSTFN